MYSQVRVTNPEAVAEFTKSSGAIRVTIESNNIYEECNVLGAVGDFYVYLVLPCHLSLLLFKHAKLFISCNSKLYCNTKVSQGTSSLSNFQIWQLYVELKKKKNVPNANFIGIHNLVMQAVG